MPDASLSFGFNAFSFLTERLQFDLDFACLLALAGLWIAYRHRFRASGLLFAACAAVGGVLFLSIYLFVAALRAKGDVETLLLGENAAGHSGGYPYTSSPTGRAVGCPSTTSA